MHCFLYVELYVEYKEEYRDKGKHLYMCFVDLKKAFDSAPTKGWSGH
mgnify:CR=1 FL=1